MGAEITRGFAEQQGQSVKELIPTRPVEAKQSSPAPFEESGVGCV
jgi:hypothetical protein